MKILVIGSTGTIGSEVTKALASRHRVAGASRSSTPSVDIVERTSIDALLAAHKGYDAVVCCAGGGPFKPLAQLDDADFSHALRDKLMGQVNVIRGALSTLADGGSITVTTGVLGQKPMVGGAALSLVNAGLEGFVRGAALEAPRGIRVNVVSPGWARETLIAFKMDPSLGLPSAQIAKAYVAAVEGSMTGEVLIPEQFL